MRRVHWKAMTPPLTGWIIATASRKAKVGQIAACHPSGMAKALFTSIISGTNIWPSSNMTM